MFFTIVSREKPPFHLGHSLLVACLKVASQLRWQFPGKEVYTQPSIASKTFSRSKNDLFVYDDYLIKTKTSQHFHPFAHCRWELGWLTDEKRSALERRCGAVWFKSKVFNDNNQRGRRQLPAFIFKRTMFVWAELPRPWFKRTHTC